jgi:hypothetical protein
MLRYIAFAFLLLTALSCRKSTQRLVPGNQVPYYDGVPTVLVENYVNRLFIDLIGREPVDSEMVEAVQFLRARSLAVEARDSLVRRLMFNPVPAAGDSSYQYFYFQRFYELMKIRLIEGASDGYISSEISIIYSGYIVDSLNGDTASMARRRVEMNKFQRILDCQLQLRYGEITIDSVCQRLVNNNIYDFINMNSFNFINATFDNLFYRYPSASEFDRAYAMVDAGTAASLFGVTGTNKTEYIDIIIRQRELYQGLIVWCYQTLMAREPNTSEVYSLLQPFVSTRNVQDVQRKILVTDEYANFR